MLSEHNLNSNELNTSRVCTQKYLHVIVMKIIPDFIWNRTFNKYWNKNLNGFLIIFQPIKNLITATNSKSSSLIMLSVMKVWIPGPTFQRADSFIQWISCYPADKMYSNQIKAFGKFSHNPILKLDRHLYFIHKL